MDISINLLPREIIAGRQKKIKQRQQFTMVGAVLCAAVAAYAALTFMTMQAAGEAARLKSERLALENQAGAYQSYAQLQARVERAEKLVGGAVGAPPHWQQLMAGIGLHIPRDVWLTDFSASMEKGGKNTPAPTGDSAPAGGEAQKGAAPGDAPAPVGELVIRGSTFDHLAVANWLEEMHKVPGLSDIRCRFSSEETREGMPLVQFEIQASLLPGPEYQPPAGKAVHKP